MLKGKVCIVTGSSAGLGAAVVNKFAKEGADGIVLHGRNVDGLNKTKAQCIQNGIAEKNVIYVAGDITDAAVQEKLVNDTINHFGRLDVLVNNAGIMDMANLQNGSLEVLDKLYQVNVRALVAMTKLCIPHLIKTKGNIVNLSTGLALKPQPFALLYSMGKAGISHLTRCLALELGPSGVRVNCVNPGYIPGTDLMTRMGITAEQLKKGDEEMKNHIAMRAFATPDDVAEAIAWIAGKATMTTGHCLPVDGGLHVS